MPAMQRQVDRGAVGRLLAHASASGADRFADPAVIGDRVRRDEASLLMDHFDSRSASIVAKA